MKPMTERGEDFMRFGKEKPKKQCPTCPSRFFTQVGLDEHIRLGQHGSDYNAVTVRRIPGYTPPVKRRRKAKAQPTPAPKAAPTGFRMSEAQRETFAETGRRVAALNNARRVRCEECGHESTPAGIGIHQKHRGHTGRTELELEKAA